MAAPRMPGDQQQGFSLMELMLVLALVGLISALGLAWLGGDPGRLYESRLQQLEVRFTRAAALARQRGWVVGWYFTDQGYRFMRLTPNAAGMDWSELGRDGPGDSRDWPEDLNLLIPGVAGAGGFKQAEPVPQRIWLPGGEQFGDVLAWSWPQGRARLNLQGSLLLGED